MNKVYEGLLNNDKGKQILERDAQQNMNVWILYMRVLNIITVCEKWKVNNKIY